MEGQRLRIKSKTAFFTAVRYLEDLIECLQLEAIVITRETKSIRLSPQGPISIELNVEPKKTRLSPEKGLN